MVENVRYSEKILIHTKEKIRMTIKKKLIFSYTIILLILLSLGITSIISLKSVNNTSTVIAEELLPRITCSQDLNYNLARYRSFEYEHIVLTDMSSMNDLETRMKDTQTAIENDIQKYKGYSNDSEIATVSSDWEKYVAEHKKLIAASRALDMDTTMSIIKGTSKTEFDEITSVVQSIVDENDASALQISAQGDNTYILVRNIIIVTLIFSVLLGTVIGVFVVQSFKIPLKTLELKLQELVDKGGDLTQSIDIKSKDEIGMLANQVNRFIQNIRAIIIEVNKASDGVENAVGTVAMYMEKLGENVASSSATVQQLSAGMEETAAAAEEVNSSANEIEDASVSMADRAQQGAISANEINSRANELKHNAIKSRGTVNEVYQSTKESLETALERSNAIAQINVLSDTILEISGQTNLLALNAAIEAARAGQAGKGFAVVADEIKTLAENSKNTVNEIQRVTEEVVTSVSELAENTRSFLEFFDSTVVNDYDSMVSTGEAYGNDGVFVDNLVGDFSATAEELTATIEGIMKAMGEVAITVNEGASGTQDIAEKITEIVRMVDEVKLQMDASKQNTKMLQNAVNKFIV